MIAMVSVLALGAACAFGGGGFLLGARLGRGARSALRAELEASAQKAQVLETEVAASKRESAATALKDELRVLADAVSSQERSQEALKAEMQAQVASIARLSNDPETLKQDLQRLVAPLVQQRDAEARKIGDMMKEVLAPMLDRDRLGRELMQVKVGTGLRDLPRVLDAICEKGGFSSVVLSDDEGLPLASNGAARNVESLAGTSALFFTLVDRAAERREARPSAVLVQDEGNQVTLHRMFTVGSSRFVLTAVGRGLAVAPGALDAALPKLENALARPEMVA